MSKRTSDEITRELAKPFPPLELNWTVADVTKTQGDRATVIPSLSASVVTLRLNEVFGVGGWSDEYCVLGSHEVNCKLSFYMEGEWIHRVGIARGQLPITKVGATPVYAGAYGAALIGAAKRIGVGQYLSRLSYLVGTIDATTKLVLVAPDLPIWAIPDEWQECGAAYAKQLTGLIKQCADAGSVEPVSLTAKLLNGNGYAAQHELAKLPKLHANAMLQEVNGWIKEIARTKPRAKEPDGARAGADSKPAEVATIPE